MFDTLDEVLSDSLDRLADGAANPGSPWRNVALGTVGLNGAPQVRTVVLRRFDRVACALDVHTDTRSAKYAELSANPAATLHGWDPQQRVQMRLTGLATLHVSDPAAEAAWAVLRPASRATYRVQPGPGTVLEDPRGVGEMDETAARTIFCVIRLTIGGLEWLHLGQAGHRRARFTWADNERSSLWLAP